MTTQAQRAEGEAAAEVVLLRGRYAGAANTALELHGVPLVLRGLEGASDIQTHTEINTLRGLHPYR
eukprot:scaffold72381_cov77-Phaeocystis_antarctica.AAC.1